MSRAADSAGVRVEGREGEEEEGDEKAEDAGEICLAAAGGAELMRLTG
jgi:hypothetical protein